MVRRAIHGPKMLDSSPALVNRWEKIDLLRLGSRISSGPVRFDDRPVEIVDAHARIDDQVLGIHSTGTW